MDIRWGLTWSSLSPTVLIRFFLVWYCSDHWLEMFIVVFEHEWGSQSFLSLCYKSSGATCCEYINDLIYVDFTTMTSCRIVNFVVTPTHEIIWHSKHMNEDHKYAAILALYIETMTKFLILITDARAYSFCERHETLSGHESTLARRFRFMFRKF